METTTIKRLYQLNVELEGLLRVLEQRDSNAARQALAEKFKEYQTAMQSFLGKEDTVAVETATETATPARDAASELNELIADTEAALDQDNAKLVTAGFATARSDENARQIKVDEMVARNESADLRKAFTLNDKFRFRRELFGGSDEAFNHTLDLLESMQTYDSARAYLTEDLQLDENNETVADFLTIIRRHYPA